MGFALRQNTRAWEDGIIPYEINESDFPIGSSQRSIINEAINEMNSKTNAWFKPRQKGRGEIDYVSFEKSETSCSTIVGKNGGKQSLACAIGDKFGLGSVVHEMMHTLGFFHEHQRYDRDNFVYVDYSNVISQNDFAKFDEKYTLTVSDYDYASIMHYPAIVTNQNLVKNSNIQTIKALKILPAEVVLGQRGALSQKDIESINSLYTTVHNNKGELLPVNVNFWWVAAGVIGVFFLILLYKTLKNE